MVEGGGENVLHHVKREGELSERGKCQRGICPGVCPGAGGIPPLLIARSTNALHARTPAYCDNNNSVVERLPICTHAGFRSL